MYLSAKMKLNECDFLALLLSKELDSNNTGETVTNDDKGNAISFLEKVTNDYGTTT